MPPALLGGCSGGEERRWGAHRRHHAPGVVRRGSARRGRAVVAADDGLDDLDPPLGLASACSSSARSVTRQCGVRVAAHRLARSTPWGVPKSRSYDAACSGAPARASRRSSRRRRWRPRSSGRAAARAGRGPARWRRAGRSRRRVARSPGCCAAGPAPRRSRCETVPSMPARPRLASTIRRSPTGWARAIRSRSRIGLLAPTKSRPPGGLAALTAAATSYGVRPGCSATNASMRLPSARSASRHSSSHVGSSASAVTASCSAVTGRAGRASGRACAPRPPRRRRGRAAAARARERRVPEPTAAEGPVRSVPAAAAFRINISVRNGHGVCLLVSSILFCFHGRFFSNAIEFDR